MALTKVTQSMFDGSALYASNFCTGVNTGESAKFQEFIDLLSTTRRLGVLDLTVYLEADIKFKSNVTLVGTGENFGAALAPIGTAKILFDGVAAGVGLTQHCQIESLLIYGNLSTAQNVIEIRNAYSNYFKNVRLHNVNRSTNINKTGIRIEGDLELRFDNLEIHGPMTYGVYMTGGQASFNQPDFENSEGASMYVGGGVATVVDPYFERFSIYGFYKGTNGSLSIFGGEIQHSGGSGLGLLVEGDNFSIHGTRYVDASGSFPKLGLIRNQSFVTSEMNRNVNLVGIPSKIIDYDILSYGPLATNVSITTDNAGTMIRRSYSRTINLADNTATTFFRIFTIGANTPTLACRFRVWAQSSGLGKAFTEYVTMVTRGSGNVAFTPLTQVFNNVENSSANWSITLSGSGTLVDANTMDFQATIDLTGTLNAGGTNDVLCTLEVEGPINPWRITEP